MTLFRRKKLKSVKNVDVVSRAALRFSFLEKEVPRHVTSYVNNSIFNPVYDIRVRLSNPIWLEIAGYLSKNVK